MKNEISEPQILCSELLGLWLYLTDPFLDRALVNVIGYDMHPNFLSLTLTIQHVKKYSS